MNITKKITLEIQERINFLKDQFIKRTKIKDIGKK